MSSSIDDGWDDDEDLDVSVTSLGDDGWGDDEDFFGEDGVDIKDPGLPPVAPKTGSVGLVSKQLQCTSGGETLESCGHDPMQPGTKSSSIQSTQSHTVMPPHSCQVPMPNGRNQDHNYMVTELTSYIESLDRILSSINAVLDFEYNTYQKAEELVEYYEQRPQLAEYTRTKELQRMDYEVVLPHGHIETKREQIIAGNLLPDNSIVSRAANQSLLADLLQVITGHDLLVRPQYFAICIATWCKFIIHHGDHGADMINCQARLSLFLPTNEGDRLSIAEATVSVVFSPSQPMVQFKVETIRVLLEDFTKLNGVAMFLSAAEGSCEDHEDMNAPPDQYRDAFLEKSQRFFALSSEGMKSAFQQMDSVMNLKGKIQSISSFIPDADQVLAAEQEAIAFADARKKELEQQRRPTFPRPSASQESTPFEESQSSQHKNGINRPKSILGGLVRSGWKTLANSMVIPDDDPAIYGAHPSQQHLLYRKEEDKPTGRQSLQRRDDAKYASDPMEDHSIDANIERPQRNRRSINEIQSNHLLAKVTNTETSDLNATGQHILPDDLQFGVNNSISVKRSSDDDQRNPQDLKIAEHKSTNLQSDENQNEKSIQPGNLIKSSKEQGEVESNEEMIENNFEDGWDDDFDDIVDDEDEIFVQQNCPFKQDQGEKEILARSSDVVVVNSLTLVEEKSHNDGTNHGQQDDVFETRKRWINPRPNRPYVLY